ncbi:MAG: hypothetical protein WD397_11375 [Wenzhouxiangellaceae bacterium]
MIRVLQRFLLPLSLSVLLCACASQRTAEPESDPGYSDNDLVISGQLERAMADTPGLDLFGDEVQQAARHWQEQRDRGDDPLVPGCACRYQLPSCGGRVVGRAVDECFPDDGVSLHEKTISTECDSYSGKRYNCEELLGEGATCRLQPMTCCGVETASAYCHLEL